MKSLSTAGLPRMSAASRLARLGEVPVSCARQHVSGTEVVMPPPILERGMLGMCMQMRC